MSPGETRARPRERRTAPQGRKEARFLSVAADYSEWLGPDELPGWEKELRTAAHSLAATTDLDPGIGAPVREPPDQVQSLSGRAE